MCGGNSLRYDLKSPSALKNVERPLKALEENASPLSSKANICSKLCLSSSVSRRMLSIRITDPRILLMNTLA
ncbi:hypothetical protein N7471_001273 [Penicillium samsonianum]|uniref:uncharacterized protein n=1 Tax=Penicillium samsonianum TaxID=1882272 RepID=UPI0025492F7C|nr:uncharacterized protein N7471_001273 [Penicillium samsonianum]KAJ6150074.1 hypothetical protein N7471_001273 [Penicillium samsonianum]